MNTELEKTVRLGVSASRWLLAPMYLGLGLLLIVLLVQFVRDFFHLLPEMFQMTALGVVLEILSLGVVVLVAHVILTILQSSNELLAQNQGSETDDPAGRAWLDFAMLRRRFLGALIAVSLLLLLREILILSEADTTHDTAKVLSVSAIVGLLVVTALLMAIADWFRALARR